MGRSSLHEFDLALCDYARGTIRSRLPKPIPEGDPVDSSSAPQRATPRPARPPAGAKRPRMDPFARYTYPPRAEGAARWLRDQLSPGLWKYLQAPNPPALLLTEEHFRDLAEALDWMPRSLLLSVFWVAWRPLYLRYMACLPEIRKLLSPTVAEKFSKTSERYIAALNQPGLKLWQGVRIVNKWVGKVRLLLRSMRRRTLLPHPEGKQPTPDHPIGTHADNSGAAGIKKKRSWTQAKVDEAVRRYRRENETDLKTLADAVPTGSRHARKQARTLFGRNAIARRLGCPSAMVSKSKVWRELAKELHLAGKPVSKGARPQRVGIHIAEEQRAREEDSEPVVDEVSRREIVELIRTSLPEQSAEATIEKFERGEMSEEQVMEMINVVGLKRPIRRTPPPSRA